MQVGIVGLGKMGSGIGERLRKAGHVVVGYDVDPQKSQLPTVEALVEKLLPPRVAWLMVPAGDATEKVVTAVAELFEAGDILIDGGNSHWADTARRAAVLEQRSIDLIDAGTSGGVWGLRQGYCLMVGGRRQAYEKVEPLLETLGQEDGYAYVGPPGAGHYAKMVHNAIEYGLLQAYAEGFELLSASQFDFDVAQVAGLWGHGSVIRSWLLDLCAQALSDDPRLSRVSGYVEDSGEGRWALTEALERSVPMPATSAAVFSRFESRRENSFAMRVIAALRREFGGHSVLEVETDARQDKAN